MLVSGAVSWFADARAPCGVPRLLPVAQSASAPRGTARVHGQERPSARALHPWESRDERAMACRRSRSHAAHGGGPS